MSEFVYKGETRPYEIVENGSVWNMPVTHCVFCKHCTDLIYDRSSGPYIFFCDKDLEISPGELEFKCDGFEDNGYAFDEDDYNKRMRLNRDIIYAHKRLLQNNPEYAAQWKKAQDEIMNKMLYGL